MSSDNLERLLDVYARFNAGERDPQELEIWHDDGEYHTAREDPDSTIHRGMEALTRHYASWVEAYPDLRLQSDEAKANGDTVFLWSTSAGTERRAASPWRWTWAM